MPKQSQKAAGVVVPFPRAAHKVRQPMHTFTSAALGAATQDFGPFDVPAYGFLRSILMEFTASGGTAGSGALAADAPWNALKYIVLEDVNGGALVGPAITGYDLYLVNRFGAYRHAGIPDLAPDAALTSVVAWKFYLRIPVEISHTDGFGSLSNQNAAETYKVRLGLAPSTDVYGTAPDVAPVVTVKMWADCWSQPAAFDAMGNAQQQAPDGHGTTQYISKFVKDVAAGQQTIQLPRMGQLLRTVICQARNSSGARVTSDYPDDMNVVWDYRQIINESRGCRRVTMQEDFGQYGYTLPAGVFVYAQTEDGGGPGDEHRNLWWPTIQATRLELVGTFGATASKLHVITNDVAPAILNVPEQSSGVQAAV